VACRGITDRETGRSSVQFKAYTLRGYKENKPKERSLE